MKKSRLNNFSRNSKCPRAHTVRRLPGKPKGLVTWHYANDGADIVMSDTTYWDSLMAHAGKPYATWSEDVLRILMPRNSQGAIDYMEDAYQVVISRGPYPEWHVQDCFEILFEDGTDEPLVLYLGANCVHLMPSAGDMPSDFLCTIWGPEGKLYVLPAKFREAKELPLRAPWTVAKLLPNDEELRFFLEHVFVDQFESHVFPYLHRFAIKFSRGAVGHEDWQYKRIAEGIVVGIPKSEDPVTAYSADGRAHTLSPEAFGKLCFMVTCEYIFHDQRELVSEEVRHHYRALIRHMEANPESSVALPWERWVHAPAR